MTGLSNLAGAASSGAKDVAKAASPELDKLKGAAKQFEAVFLRQMIGSMRSASSDDDGLFDSSATRQFRDMSDAKLADQMAAKGALHIADMLVKAYGARLSGTAGATAPGAVRAEAAVHAVGQAVTGAARAAAATAATFAGAAK